MPRLSTEIARNLQAMGLPFCAAPGMKDLGVGTRNAGPQRNSRTTRARTDKAKARAAAVRTLRKVDGRAKHLIATNITPMQFYRA